MSAIAKVQRSYDLQEPREVIAEDWQSTPCRQLTEAQIEQFIFDIAENGSYPDALGKYKDAPSLYLVLAMEYRRDKSAIPSAITTAFFDWAKSAAYCAEFGKPYQMPSILCEQAGLRVTSTNND